MDGRRNLSPDQARLLRGRRYNRAKRQGARTDLTSGQNDQKSTTADRLAKEHGVSPATIRRDGKFAEEVEKTPELAEAVRAGKPVFQVKREMAEQRREERRAGELLRGMEKHPPGPSPVRSRDVTDSDLGITKMQSHRWQVLAVR